MQSNRIILKIYSTSIKFIHLNRKRIKVAKNKTTTTTINVDEFNNTYIDNKQKKNDSLALMELMTKWSGFQPKMWGPTIIGFGTYHYKYASGHEGDAPLIGFSPRKAKFSLYVTSCKYDNKQLLEEIGN